MVEKKKKLDSAGHPVVECKVCSVLISYYSKECPRCGWQNPNFVAIPEEQRDEVYIEFWHDRGVYNTVVKLAKKRDTTVEKLYKDAMEICISKDLL